MSVEWRGSREGEKVSVVIRVKTRFQCSGLGLFTDT